MDLNPYPPKSIVAPQILSKSESLKVDLTILVAYSKKIETPFRDLWVHKYQYLHYKLRNFKPLYLDHFLSAFDATGLIFKGIEALFPTCLLLLVLVKVSLSEIEKKFNEEIFHVKHLTELDQKTMIMILEKL